MSLETMETLPENSFHTLSSINSTYPSTIWDKSSASYARTLAKYSVSAEKLWGYHGDIMGMPWGYHVDTISRGYLGNIKGTSWKYQGDIRGEISWKFHGEIILGISGV